MAPSFVLCTSHKPAAGLTLTRTLFVLTDEQSAAVREVLRWADLEDLSWWSNFDILSRSLRWIILAFTKADWPAILQTMMAENVLTSVGP